MTSILRLRHIQPADIEWMAAMACDPEQVGTHNWAGESRSVAEVEAQLREQLESGQLQGRYNGGLVVEIDGDTPIGDVSWRPAQWGPSIKSRCPAFGIALKPEFRGRGFGSRAQRLLIDFLFERDPELERIQSDTADDNPAEQRALLKIGMTQEGVVRSAEFRDGEYHDHFLYSILRNEWTPSSD